MKRYLLAVAVALASMTVTKAQSEVPLNCGDPVDALDAWPTIPAKYNSGRTEESCDGLGQDGYRYQCVELIRRFYREAHGIDTGTPDWCCNGAHGKAFFGRAEAGLLNQGDHVFRTFPNGHAISPPMPEDIVGFGETIFPRNPYGHVALVKRVQPRPDGAFDVEIIEQNAKDSSRILRAERRADGTYLLTGRLAIQGWIRHEIGAPATVFQISGGAFAPSAGTAFSFNPYVAGQRIAGIQVSGPAGWNGDHTFVIPNVLFQPPGTARERAFWWQFIAPISGTYAATATIESQLLQSSFIVSTGNQLAAPQITDFMVERTTGLTNVRMSWVAPTEARSFMVRVNAVPWPGFAVQDIVVTGLARSFTFTGMDLLASRTYQALVFAFNQDLGQAGGLPADFNVSAASAFFVAP